MGLEKDIFYILFNDREVFFNVQQIARKVKNNNLQLVEKVLIKLAKNYPRIYCKTFFNINIFWWSDNEPKKIK